jgi:hypothetical protein
MGKDYDCNPSCRDPRTSRGPGKKNVSSAVPHSPRKKFARPWRHGKIARDVVLPVAATSEEQQTLIETGIRPDGSRLVPGSGGFLKYVGFEVAGALSPGATAESTQPSEPPGKKPTQISLSELSFFEGLQRWPCSAPGEPGDSFGELNGSKGKWR